MLGIAFKMSQDLEANLPWIMQVFEEAMDTVSEEAKSEIEAFERKHNVRLPEEYRQFRNVIGLS